MQEYLSELNNEQLRAATSIKGAYRLVAGAGSGKTNTLTKRVAYICESQNIPVSRILSLTFTNKAAAEMKERVAKLLGLSNTDNLSMCTFHKLCLDILKEDGAGVTALGWDDNDFDIYENGQGYLISKFMREYAYIFNNISDLHVKEKWMGKKAKERVEKSLEQRFVDFLSKEVSYELKYGDYVKYLDLETYGEPRELSLLDESEFTNLIKGYHENYNKIESLKDDIKKLNKEIYDITSRGNYSVNDISDKFTTVNRYNEKIEELKQDSKELRKQFKPFVWSVIRLKIKDKIITYDDLISIAVYLLKTREDILERWQGKYDYIQIDECQDTDMKQLELIQLLYQSHGNLFVVGDPDQSIYLFRGAEPEVFNRLDEYIPNLTTIKMENNYRSNDAVVEISNKVIQLNQNRLQKTCKSQGMAESRLAEFILAEDVEKTALEVVVHIKLLVSKGVKLQDIAILYQSRSSELTKAIIKELNETGYQLDDTFPSKSLKREEIESAIMNTLKYNYTEDLYYLIKVFDCPTISCALPSNLDKIISTADDEFKLKTILKNVVLKKYLGGRTPSITEEEIDSFVDSWLSMPDDEKDKACKKEDALEDTGLAGDSDIHIITIHKSKGLEWQYVFVVGDKTTAKTSKDLEEYARLYYVAYSRAKVGLYIISQNTPVVSQLFVDGDLDKYILTNTPIEKDECKATLDEYRGTMTRYGFGKPEYRRLIHKGDLVGYRSVQYVDGKRVGFQADIDLLRNAGCEPEKCYGKAEVLGIEDNHFTTFDELNGVMTIIDVTDESVVPYIFEKTPMISIVKKCIDNYRAEHINGADETEGIKNVLFIGENPVALRLTKDNKKYDINIGVVEKLGIDYNSKLSGDYKKIQLRKINDVWMSKSEYASGNIIKELGEQDKELIFSMI